MTASSAERVATSRKTVQVVLQGLAGASAASVAQAVGVSESTISRFKSEHLDTVAAILAELELKVVPVQYRCYEPSYIDALERLAREQLNAAKAPPQLEW